MRENDNQEHRASSADGNRGSRPLPPLLGRRTLIMGAAAVGVGAAASLAAGAEPAMAANGGDVQLGKTNKATATTTVTTTKGNGVAGETSAGGGSGLYGKCTNTGADGGYGVQGVSSNGPGVYGSSSGNGVEGAGGVGGTNGYGVVGQGTLGGVYGLTNNDNQYGVYGVASGAAEEAFGVYGLASGEDGTGVWGKGAYIGTAGVCTGSDGIGVFASGSAEEGSFGLSVSGNAAISGSLSKGGGSFKIDHPLDPARKYLYHSFVESPDMMNVYNGTVVLDRQGRARVELPDWFEALNRDFRYQLTAIGAPAPNLHISSRVAEGTFGIAGGHEGQEVSWQVTGIRQDAWANAHRIVVEVDKPAEDQGRYLHPELVAKDAGHLITALAKARTHTQRHRKATTA
jgi:hypothetical protein